MDLEQIESLLKMMKEYQVAALEVETEDVRLKLDMVSNSPQVIHALPAAAVAAPTAAEAAPEEVVGEVIKSPMVGTYYSAAKPDSPPFVTVGSVVQKGSVLCILEAMKLMNELESEVAGTVAEVYVDNAQPVQFGQPLFRITTA
jgi:acetyl-CoA carboxylase biotin carboxyl carrier protein